MKPTPMRHRHRTGAPGRAQACKGRATREGVSGRSRKRVTVPSEAKRRQTVAGKSATGTTNLITHPTPKAAHKLTDSVRNSFLTLGCTIGPFGPSEQRQATRRRARLVV